jgi:3-methyladenine DNA glycosylase AlkD
VAAHGSSDVTLVEAVREALRQASDASKATQLARFFKTGPGEYGEGDRFLGLTVPQVRSVAKRFPELSPDAVRSLMASAFHEERFCALVVLTQRYRRSHEADERRELWSFYLELLDAGGINNWDLVDASAPYFGAQLVVAADAAQVVQGLIAHRDLWHQRVGVMLTWALIKRGELDLTFLACEQLLDHPHDLIHKACGWMLREAGKRNLDALRSFLNRHLKRMPRTMLRYAIERMSLAERRGWLAR